MEPNFQGLGLVQTRGQGLWPGLAYGYKKTGLLCCFVERLQVGIPSWLLELNSLICIFLFDLPVRSVAHVHVMCK